MRSAVLPRASDGGRLWAGVRPISGFSTRVRCHTLSANERKICHSAKHKPLPVPRPQ